jgi:lipid-binding SYLF domain-containing protein
VRIFNTSYANGILKVIAVCVLMSVALIVAPTAVMADMTAKEQKEAQKKLRKEVKGTLAQLYKLHPSSKAAINKAYGYAVFDNFGTNLGVLSTASGKGIAYDNTSKKELFMRMYSGGVGIGLGVKDYRLVFVFQTKKAFDSFVTSGWEGSAQADAAAKAGKDGGAVSGATAVSDGVWVYQYTKNGLAAQATLQGTKYWKYDDLNNPPTKK